MKIAKYAFMVIGTLVLFLGLIWMGQGSGYFRYPANSFMIDQSAWIWRGAAMAVLGAVLIYLARRSRHNNH